MRARTILLLSVAVLLTIPSARALASDTRPINASLLFPIATNRTPDISTTVNIGILYSHVGSVRAFGLDGLVSHLESDLRGLQLTGAYSHVGGEMRGVSLTGGINYVRGSASGIQFAGLVNYDRGFFKGFQYAWLFNYTESGFRGVQWSPVFNLNDGDASILQVSGLAGFVSGSFNGVQLGAGINYVAGRLDGVQIGAANFATDADGVRLGVANFAGTAKGLQIGVLNWSRTLDGTPVGVLNFTDDSDTRWITYGSNYAGISTGVLTNVAGWYSILATGAVDLKDDLDDTSFFEWHYGRYVTLGESFSLAPDIGFVHVAPTPSVDPAVNDEQHFALQARAALEFRLGGKFHAFAGGGLSVIFDRYSTSANQETDPLFFGGVTIF